MSKDRRYKTMVNLCLNQRIGEVILVDLLNRSTGEAIASKRMAPPPRLCVTGKGYPASLLGGEPVQTGHEE